jgi:hypothetical protein
MADRYSRYSLVSRPKFNWLGGPLKFLVYLVPSKSYSRILIKAGKCLFVGVLNLASATSERHLLSSDERAMSHKDDIL